MPKDEGQKPEYTRIKKGQSQTWQELRTEQKRNPPHFGQGWDLEQTSLHSCQKLNLLQTIIQRVTQNSKELFGS